MSSSSKYHKFDSQLETITSKEDHSPKTERSTKRIVFGLVAILCVSLLVAVALAVGVGVGVTVSQSSNTAGEEEGLTVISLSQGELEGKYLSSGSDGGIHFRSTVNDTHFVLSISTTNGELIVTITQPLVLNMTLLGINQTDFLIMKNHPGHPKYDDYLVPSEMMEVMESVMRGDVEMTEDMVSHLDKEHVNETRETVLHDFAVSREAQLIIETALALGESLGITGREFPSVMRLYRLALQLGKMRQYSIHSGIAITIDTTTARTTTTAESERARDKRQFSSCSNGETGCDVCPASQSDECFGLCGYGCTCWELVCGDCCAHQYCISHDFCCAQEGFFSIPCFYVGIDYLTSLRDSCDDTYQC